MNEYRQRVGLNRVEPSQPSMGKFFSHRLRDSIQLGSTTRVGENFDETTADYEATPEPPMNLNEINQRRTLFTPSSTSSMNDNYFTHSTSRDIRKFSRNVELSSGYNILKNRTSTRPIRLPTYLQGRTPLAQLHPLPTSSTTTVLPEEGDNHEENNRRRRLSLTDHLRTQTLTYSQHLLQQFNVDGTRRPFSSDSPLPPPLPTAPLTSYYTSSAPPVNHRPPFEPLKFPIAPEDNSIAALSRELRAAAYPTTRKSSTISPTRETSPPSTRYSTRHNSKRLPPRSLPKLLSNEQYSSLFPQSSSNIKVAHFYHHYQPSHELEKPPITTTTTTTTTADDHLQSSSTASLLLDQFFTAEPVIQSHESTLKSSHEHSQASVLLNNRNPSVSNSADDSSMSFVSKYARLAPIISSQTIVNVSEIVDENNNDVVIHEENILDSLLLRNDNETLTDDLLQTSEMNNTNSIIDHPIGDDFSYVPLKEEQRISFNDIPLLELDELETNSDMSESQLVPIIYAKELENEIGLLQKAHLLKQQQRQQSLAAAAENNDDERIHDNSSIPPPANMELLNFEALEEEFTVQHRRDDTSLTPSPRSPSATMEISSSPPPPPEVSSTIDIETSIHNIAQHGALAHNRSSPWFKLPTELWFKVLLHLNQIDLYHFSLACKRFYLLVQDQACRHRIRIHRQMTIKTEWLDVIQRQKPISLTFDECRQQELEDEQEPNAKNENEHRWCEFFQSIGSNLLHLTMANCYHEPLTPNMFLPIIIQTCSNLLSLNLRWNNMTQTTLNYLSTYAQCANLRSLDLSGCLTLDDTLLIDIFIRPNTHFHLHELILHACTNLTWTSLDTIAICLPHLFHLNLSRCIGLKQLSFHMNTTCFQHWSKLESIDLSFHRTLIDDDLILIFYHCKQLRILILEQCINLSTNILMNLNRQCSQLCLINLNSISNMNDTCLLEWSKQPFIQLDSLILDSCTECTLYGIQLLLESHSTLRQLSLTNCGIIKPLEREQLETTYAHVQFVFQTSSSS